MCGIAQFIVKANEATFVGSIAPPCAATIGLRGADHDTWQRYFAAYVADRLRLRGYEPGEGRVTLHVVVRGGMAAEVRMMALGQDAVLHLAIDGAWDYPSAARVFATKSPRLRPSPGRTVEP